MKTLDLWWSLLWRLTIVLLVLSFVLYPVAQALLLGANPIAAVEYRPSVGWWLLAASFCGAGAASPRFVRLVLWGERLDLANSQWLAFFRGIAIFFVLLGFVNVLVANYASAASWVNFKLFWPSPLLIVALLPIAAGVRRTHAQSGL